MAQSKKRIILLLAIMAVMMVLFSISSPYFLKVNNLMSILREASTVGILALGMTFVIITAGIDLSIGSIVAFCAMLMLNMFENLHMPLILVLPFVCIVATAIGMLNGVVITKLHVPDFIVTLSTQVIFRGLTTVIAMKDMNGNIRNINIANKAFGKVAGSIGPVHNVIIVFILLAVAAYIILKFTRIGTSLYAVGAHKRAAELSGVHVDKTKIFAYAFCGLMAGIAAIYMCARIKTATAELADGYELDVIAAVIVGGTLFAGGKGEIPGTVVGAVFLAMLQNGIYKFDISSAYTPIIIGVVIILSIMFDELSRRLQEYKAHKRRLAA